MSEKRNPPEIVITNLSKRFGVTSVLSDVTATIPAGSIVGLVGPSGGGKSTLMKILGSVIDEDSGELDRSGLGFDEVSLMFQEGALFDSISVADNVAFPLVDGKVPLSRLSHSKRKTAVEKVSSILSRVGLFAASHKMPAQISGGMRRRVSLARALVCEPRLALLDDPTAGLDPVASSVIMDLIVELHRESCQTTIIASHDLRRLLPVCDEIVALFAGEVVFQGAVSELKASPHAVQEFIACRFDFDDSEHAHPERSE
jgi:phospholipid/cholesterol/gamma-HCH transport system ATP-binding protein